MSDLDYVLQTIGPWLDDYINRGPDALGHRQTVGVGVWLLEADVNNGGFHQYYSNSRGVLAERTVDALIAIGAPETASLLRAANQDISRFPLPEDRRMRFAILDEISESSRFGALETEFYAQREDRVALLANFLRVTENEQ